MLPKIVTKKKERLRDVAFCKIERRRNDRDDDDDGDDDHDDSDNEGDDDDHDDDDGYLNRYLPFLTELRLISQLQCNAIVFFHTWRSWK